jgi:hypothetical protein
LQFGSVVWRLEDINYSPARYNITDLLLVSTFNLVLPDPLSEAFPSGQLRILWRDDYEVISSIDERRAHRQHGRINNKSS